MTAETYTGAPCAHGHTLRYRSNRKCVACACVPAQFFALSPNALTAAPVTMIEAVYARRPGWTYWRATELTGGVPEAPAQDVDSAPKGA